MEQQQFQTLEQLEKEHILKALEMTRGQMTRAAKMLGINRRTLYRKVKLWKSDESDVTYLPPDKVAQAIREQAGV